MDTALVERGPGQHGERQVEERGTQAGELPSNRAELLSAALTDDDLGGALFVDPGAIGAQDFEVGLWLGWVAGVRWVRALFRGFAEEGREYVTFLGPGQSTPAPWINVVANPSPDCICKPIPC